MKKTNTAVSLSSVIVLSYILAASSFGFSPQPQKTATALDKIPVVICPGFGNDAIDYLNPLNRGEEYSFVNALTKRGFNPDLIQVLPLKRYEWIRVAGGLFDVNFYTMTCTPEGLGYGWYVKRLRQTIEELYQKAGGEQRCLVIAHSAGGWLARAALSDGSWNVEQINNNNAEKCGDKRAASRVLGLVTIGAIHRPPDKDFEATCVTRGALKYLNSAYPGAFLANEGTSYVSVGGDAILGKKQQKASADDVEKVGSEQVNLVYKDRGEGSASSVAYTSYAAVSGIGERTGDGVVPLEWALLEGSKTIVLDGVLHSINEAGTTLPTDRWYGSDDVVDSWLQEALKEAGIKVDGNKNEQKSKSNFFESLRKNYLSED